MASVVTNGIDETKLEVSEATKNDSSVQQPREYEKIDIAEIRKKYEPVDHTKQNSQEAKTSQTNSNNEQVNSTKQTDQEVEKIDITQIKKNFESVDHTKQDNHEVKKIEETQTATNNEQVTATKQTHQEVEKIDITQIKKNFEAVDHTKQDNHEVKKVEMTQTATNNEQANATTQAHQEIEKIDSTQIKKDYEKVVETKSASHHEIKNTEVTQTTPNNEQVNTLNPTHQEIKKNLASVDVDTIFGQILRKEHPVKIVYEDDICMAIEHFEPESPVHLVVFPRKKITQLSKATEDDKPILGHMLYVIKKIAPQNGLEDGFRVVINEGYNANQDIFHLHVHVLGGCRGTRTFFA